jgi:hypothetical protein
MALPLTIIMTQRRTSTETLKEQQKGSPGLAPFFILAKID